MIAAGNNQVSYARNLSSNGGRDSKLDRSYEYDQVGALLFAHSGAEARATFGIDGQGWGTSDGPYSHMYDYDKQGNMTRRFGWGGEVQRGTPNGGETTLIYGYSNGKNQRDGLGYDAAGNLKDGESYWHYVYNAVGQQTNAVQSNGPALVQGYDGEGLRGQKIENETNVTYYLRSTVLGGAVISELDGNGSWTRGYVYRGDQLIATQSNSQVTWVHEDPITKSQRITDTNGSIITNGVVELDPWGANTSFSSSSSAFQPHQISGYTKDVNGDQDAMARRYSPTGRFSQPDPYSGSYDFSDPQSLNRYAYVGNDPVNRKDPSGMEAPTCMLDGMPISCTIAGLFLNAGAGVRGPASAVRYNPNSDGYGTAGFETFRAVGNNAGWFNVYGVLITVDAYINGQYVGSATPIFQTFRSFGGNSFIEVQVPEVTEEPARITPPPKGPRTVTPEGFRMGKFVDCLDQAKQWYVDAEQKAGRDYSNSFTNPWAAFGYGFSFGWGGPSGVAKSFLRKVIVNGAYYSGVEVGNYKVYRRLEGNCYAQWGSQ